MNRKKIILSITILAVLILLIIDPKTNIDACLKGIKLWATSILPALFPFFFLTAILAELGFIQKLGNLFSPATKALYKTPGISGYIYLMSIISGYPVGAKTTADLYEKNYISRGQACKITTFTSTSGPLFIVGTVGVSMFGSAKLGYLILISHILGAFLNGIIYRNTFKEDVCPLKVYTQSANNVLEDVMFGSIKSILVVGGYIALFYMLITMLNSYHIFSPLNNLLALLTHTNPSVTGAFTNGLIEVTRGCLDVSTLGFCLKKALVICTGLISFGGLSIHMQALTFLKKFDMPLGFYFRAKVTQTLISVGLAYLFSFFI
mgnify:CR=1 FL=1